MSNHLSLHSAALAGSVKNHGATEPRGIKNKIVIN